VFNNGSFVQGGRLWGGFWMNLKKQRRREDITIEREPIVELDYGQMALRLLYAKVGAPLPEGDLYAVPGLRSREGVKKIINAALFSDRTQRRMPQGARQYFGDEVTYREALTAIKQRHAPIADYFFKGLGMELMFRESEILIDVLLRVQEQGKVALPLHDGLLTSRSAAPVVKETMEEVFRRRTGIEASVRLER
jgi:hypothetical protein